MEDMKMEQQEKGLLHLQIIGNPIGKTDLG